MSMFHLFSASLFVQRFYGKKGADHETSHKQKLKELERQQLQQKQNEHAQKEMFELMKLQMEAQLATKEQELQQEPEK